MPNWVVMFVDMVGSTGFKYRQSDKVVQKTIHEMYGLIRDCTDGDRSFMKFTGDGAMLTFTQEAGGCRKAVLAAERILQALDAYNLTFDPNRPLIHIRIGIATGACDRIGNEGDITGRSVDLAKRLCDETEIDSVLLDDEMKKGSSIAPHRFTLCRRRLALKGVPITSDQQNNFHYFNAHRLLNAGLGDYTSKGLLSLYPDRRALRADFNPARLIDLAAPESTILIAGRTLIGWTQYTAEMHMAARALKKGGKEIVFQFLLSSRESGRYLESEQNKLVAKDWPKTERVFLELTSEDPEHFDFRITQHLFLDGITCCRVSLPHNGILKKSPAPTKLVVLQDINAAAGEAGEGKACLLLGCTCNHEDEKGGTTCKAHGLYRRTRLIWAQERRVTPSSVTPCQQILSRHQEGLNTRNNQVSSYLYRVVPHFMSILNSEVNVPAPLCVQLQISSQCSTHCVMCDHHRTPIQNELKQREWKAVFQSLATLGVGAVVLSGGEPLMCGDLVNLLTDLSEKKLAVGMLSNGTMAEKTNAERKKILAAIRQHVKWVAISVDGTRDEDYLIRRTEEPRRIRLLKEFVDELEGGPSISATVTLQKDNIGMSLRRACTFMNQELGIEQVNFKLVTGGSGRTSHEKPDYLLSAEEVDELCFFLWNYPVDQEHSPRNNLAYLRRCFANGVFDRNDVSAGVPVSSFYSRQKLRCFTPYLFAVIDSDGKVYPCCHLYRDNQGGHSSSNFYRKEHCMGDLRSRKFDFDFDKVWNGKKYAELRAALKEVQPGDPRFSPCGECTRHYQHNWVLTEIYREYKDRLDDLESELSELKLRNIIQPSNEPVWF